MNRRDFLKRLGFSIAGLPLAGKLLKIEEPKEVYIEPDEELEESPEPASNPELDFSDNPYFCDTSKWVYAAWPQYPASTGYDTDTTIDGEYRNLDED